MDPEKLCEIIDEDLEDDDAMSVDSVTIERVVEAVLDPGLCYRCVTCNGIEIFDRSDLMDDGDQQRLVLAFEKRNPPPWDEECPVCGSEGCEECECADCERKCRFIAGINYGCEKHPVV